LRTKDYKPPQILISVNRTEKVARIQHKPRQVFQLWHYCSVSYHVQQNTSVKHGTQRGSPNSILRNEQWEFFSSLPCPDRLWGPSSLLYNGHRGLGQGVKLTNHLHLVPWSRMRGAIPPLPSTPSWRGAQLKKAQGQIYLYLEMNRKFCIAYSDILGTWSLLPWLTRVYRSCQEVCELLFQSHTKRAVSWPKRHRSVLSTYNANGLT
jgi:hypothetical protein